MNSDRTKFLLLGTAKCGTTSLCSWVGQHPDVYVAPIKEPVFFEAEYERGMDYYWSTYYPTLGAERAIGEGRTYNLYLPFVPDRIAAGIPDARLIALLRDPVQRAYSHWWHRVTRRQERMSFADAVATDLRRIEAGDLFEGEEGARRWRSGLTPGTRATRFATYVEMGYYARQLQRYRDRFPADRLRVYFQEDMARDPLALVRDFWGFVGVDGTRGRDDEIARNVARNAARTAQQGSAEHLLGSIARGLRADRFVPRAAWKAARGIFRKQPVTRPPLSEEASKELEAHYAPHDRELVRLLGRPVPYLADRAG